MKTIGIIGAMESEVARFKQNMDIISTKRIAGVDFCLGKMYGKSIVVARSRVGKVNAAICAQVLIDLYGVDYIVNCGVAGAVAPELLVCDIIISADLVHYDYDVTAIGDPPGVNTSIPESYFKADEELVKIAKMACDETLTDNKAYIARIASGDSFVSADGFKQSIWKTFKAWCVEMEGAAIAQTCYLNRIPFVVIRAMSDSADRNAVETFGRCAAAAVKNASDVVECMLKYM